MRIFSSFPEAFSEIRRDLKEMGVPIRTKTMQDKIIEGEEGFETLELMNYVYTVTNATFEDLEPTQPWANLEWEDRCWGIEGNALNPGIAYKSRPDVWDEFLHEGRFSYTYSERFSKANQVKRVIERLKKDRYSRQLYIAMWGAKDSEKLGQERVPCSLGWHFMFREGQLHMTYFMRSCDFSTHFQNDVYLALKLQNLVASEAGLLRGRFTHFISSFHIYKKDVDHVF